VIQTSTVTHAGAPGQTGSTGDAPVVEEGEEGEEESGFEGRHRHSVVMSCFCQTFNLVLFRSPRPQYWVTVPRTKQCYTQT